MIDSNTALTAENQKAQAADAVLGSCRLAYPNLGIAELTGKVRIHVRRMFEDLELGQSKFGPAYQDAKRKRSSMWAYCIRMRRRPKQK